MKLFLAGVMVFIFIVLPLHMLDTLVLPEILDLKQTYQQADSVAARIVN
jgi:hypothetical protein